MKLKRYISITAAIVCCLILFTGCSKPNAIARENSACVQTDLASISVPSNVQVVGLGEASHGVSEYHQMKAEVFKALAANNDCRTFIIEGDFGGALKVDDYIQGGSGNTEEVVGEIGFAIYRTREMADLVDWMRSYNETAPADRKLHFYGMDSQRFDNNKEYLFSVLEKTIPELSAKYSEAFSQLKDEQRTSLDAEALNRGKEAASALRKEMETAEADIVKNSSQSDFDFAKACANAIYAYCDILSSDNYNATRDQYMFERVDWFLQHGDGSVLFINGHNGHIGKTSVAGYATVGKLLAESLNEGYYSIGTDAQNTKFNSQNDDGSFEVVEVSNKNELNDYLDQSNDKPYFVDFSTATADEAWKQIINSEQTITTLNVSLPSTLKLIKAAYTTKIVPIKTFDGMIVFRNVSPTTLIK